MNIDQTIRQLFRWRKMVERYTLFIPEIPDCEYIDTYIYEEGTGHGSYIALSTVKFYFTSDDLWESPFGFGTTKYEAMTEFLECVFEYIERSKTQPTEIQIEDGI